MRHLLPLLFLATVPAPSMAAGVEASLPAQASAALRKAVVYFREHVATEGGYLWRYSEDLSKREGEGKATATMVWVQPPGTPSVGMALLGAYHATKDACYLDAAHQAGTCLVRGQLRSGGWDYRIEFDPQRRPRYAYRVDPPTAAKQPANTSTLDDDVTQSALRFLMRLDQTLRFEDVKIHEAVEVGLKTLLAVQYPNGAWPQRFTEPPDPAKFPVKKASYPESWSRTWPHEDYRSHYTFNDNTSADTIETLLLAAEIYNEPRYRAAAEKGGDFILLAQMPEPQPAWAQQYNAQMHPAWARKFEPPSITGGESQGVLRVLVRLARATGNKKYLEPIPAAAAYLKRSLLPNGQLARFYELKTNKPLYFTKDYQLTYDDSDMPTHYGFKVSPSFDRIQREYERLVKLDPKELKEPARPSSRKSGKPPAGAVKKAIAALDAQGRWVEKGRLRYWGDADPTQRVIDCETFIQNVRVLAAYLAAAK